MLEKPKTRLRCGKPKTYLIELLFSQRLILQPSFEANLALQEVEEYGIGCGIKRAAQSAVGKSKYLNEVD